MNSVVLCIAGERQELMDNRVDSETSNDCVLNVGQAVGAYAAAYFLVPVKWTVGCGVESQAPGRKEVPRVVAFEQHGVVGYALRAAVGKVGTACGVAVQNNLGVRLADATMAALRLVLVTLPEASIMSLFFILSAAAQFILDIGTLIQFCYKLGASKLASSRAAVALGYKSGAERPQPEVAVASLSSEPG